MDSDTPDSLHEPSPQRIQGLRLVDGLEVWGSRSESLVLKGLGFTDLRFAGLRVQVCRV